MSPSKARHARLLAALAVMFVAGCGSAAKEMAPATIAEPPPPPSRTKYVISAGDELEVRFFYTPELNAELPVRPDGYISLPYAREVEAAGRTPEELAEELTRRYSSELRNPEIAVVVRSFTTQKIHVGGRVESPGVFPLLGPTTVLQALFEAGGTSLGARLSEVLVIRRTPGEPHTLIAVDVGAILDGTDPSQNIALRPLDAVYVPDSPIAKVNEFVDSYIRKNIPVDFGLRAGTGF